MPSIADRTYIEDMKDPIKVLPPSSNLILVVLCMQGLRGRIFLAQLDNLVLYPGHGSGLRT